MGSMIDFAKQNIETVNKKWILVFWFLLFIKSSPLFSQLDETNNIAFAFIVVLSFLMTGITIHKHPCLLIGMLFASPFLIAILHSLVWT